MKTVFVMAFALIATLASAEMPVITELPEIPAKYCGTYYLHGKMKTDGGEIEQVSPAKPFGKIETKQVTLDGGEFLSIKSIKQIEMSSIQGKGILIWFEKTDFLWSIREMPDSTLQIMQTDVHHKKPTTTFIVSHKQ